MSLSDQFAKAVAEQKRKTESKNPLIAGTLGITMGGQTIVEVPDRPSYVYVQVRSSQAEIIQAFNQTVSPVYGLPVFIQWQGNRYVVTERDTMRYSNWIDSSAYLPRHASTHEARGSAGDVVFVAQEQFLPLLPTPSGSLGNGAIIVNDYNLQGTGGNFTYFPAQATVNMTAWNPSSPTGAIMALVTLDASNNQLKYFVNSGNVFGNWLTGTADVLPQVFTNPDLGRYLPIAAVRLVSGTQAITWDNIYDVRPLFGLSRITIASAGGGGGSTGIMGVVGQDEGVMLGTGTYLNFVGAGVTATISGSVINVNVPGGGGSSPTGTDATYLRLDATNDPVFGLLHLQKNGGYTSAVGVLTIGQSGTTENGVFHRMWSNGNIAGYRLENYHSDASYDYFALNKYVDAIGYYVEQLISGSVGASQPAFSAFRLNEVNGTANWSEAAIYVQAPATHDFGGALHLQDTSFVDRLWLNPGVVGAGAAQAYLFDTYAAVSTGTTTNLINAKNHGTSKFTVNANGDVNGGVTITFATGDGRTVTVKGGIITSVA